VNCQANAIVRRNVGRGTGCKLKWVQGVRKGGADVGSEALHDDGCQCYRAVVIQAGDGGFLRSRTVVMVCVKQVGTADCYRLLLLPSTCA